MGNNQDGFSSEKVQSLKAQQSVEGGAQAQAQAQAAQKVQAEEPQKYAKPNNIYMSQYAMNKYGVTNVDEFVTNAVKRIPKGNRVEKIKSIYKFKKKLGEGATGRCLLVQDKKSKDFFALK